MHAVTTDKPSAIAITWQAEPATFDKHYDKTVRPVLQRAHDDDLVSMVLPFHHKPVHHPDAPDFLWTNSAIVLLNDAEQLPVFSSSLIDAARAGGLQDCFRTAVSLRPQPKVDMYYPIGDGLKREKQMNRQYIEYVFSQPQAREQYYKEQYVWSGPSMRDSYMKNATGRFLGFEHGERIEGRGGVPSFDLIHIIGFTPLQTLKATFMLYPPWNRRAKEIWGLDMNMKQKIKEWGTIRLNVKSKTVQDFMRTIQDPRVCEDRG